MASCIHFVIFVSCHSQLILVIPPSTCTQKHSESPSGSILVITVGSDVCSLVFTLTVQHFVGSHYSFLFPHYFPDSWVCFIWCHALINSSHCICFVLSLLAI